MIAATDVEVAAHAGFDRVVVEHSGDAPIGWRTACVEDARARGVLGLEEPAEVVLEITIRNITPPDEPSDELQTRDAGPIEGPPGGVIELVDAAVTDAHHVIVVGVPEELRYLVEYVDAPPGRLIVDIFHRSPPAGADRPRTGRSHPQPNDLTHPPEPGWPASDVPRSTATRRCRLRCVAPVVLAAGALWAALPGDGDQLFGLARCSLLAVPLVIAGTDVAGHGGDIGGRLAGSDPYQGHGSDRLRESLG